MTHQQTLDAIHSSDSSLVTASLTGNRDAFDIALRRPRPRHSGRNELFERPRPLRRR